MDRGLTAEKRKAEDGEAGIKKPRTLGASGQKQQSSSFEQDLELEFGEVGHHGEDAWPRTNPSPIDPASTPLVFQQIEIDDYLEGRSGMPVVRLYGVTDQGHSVLCHAHDFLPYFYLSAPEGFDESHIRPFIDALDRSIEPSVERNAVVRVDIEWKKSIWGYHGGKPSPFLRITFREHRYIAAAKRTFESGFGLQGLPLFSTQTFESNIAYVLRFMIDLKISGANWIELPPSTYSLRHVKTGTAQYEVDVSYAKIISHAPVGEWGRIAPLRILSFDIECAGRKGIFPEPDVDPVIQIASIVTVQGQRTPFIRNVMTLKGCSPIAGTHVMSFDQEKDLLVKWQEFMSRVDPDVIIGYNTANFDLPYLIDRASHLRCSTFPYLGRLLGVETRIKNTRFSSKAHGTRESKEINMEGRIQLDMLQVMQRDYKLRSYTLNAVCAHFLGEQKEDVHHSIITELQQGSDETRRRLAVYCLKDAYLPQRLMDKLMCLYNYMEMARVTGVPFNYLLTRGQQIKVISQLYRKALDEDLVIPAMRSGASDEAYEGATVIEPIKGYYDVPIATLDFASLYPSIMMAHNLCYTTLLKPQTISQLGLKKDVDYEETPTGDCFVKAKHQKGILPIILEDLLGARKRAKADLKRETDPFVKAVLDGRQLALKISANSVYGFTGATVGKLPCLQISSSVTAYGRVMIERTRHEVEQHFTKANGYPADAQVIYGDTDSVMVRFGVNNLEKAMSLGQEAAEFATQKFIQPIRLEFEKVYFPYLLINKKRYAGLYWTRPDKYDKMDTKGIETVRRDNCRLVQTVIDTCLRKILIDQDIVGAQDYAKQVISDLLQNKIDLSLLVISKALTKTEYDAKQAHAELAKRMKKRDAGSAPALGDRVAYVIIKAAKGAAAYEKSEDPIWVLENNLPIDTNYYLDNQLSKPLMRIFEPILKDKASSLLNGEHTRTVSVSAPTVGGLMRFTVKRLKCLGCKALLPDGEKTVCKDCKGRVEEVYHRQLEIKNEMEMQYNRLWTQCQRCQGSLHQDVLCSSRDCPIFYMRKRAQKDVSEAAVTLTRFDDW